MAMLNARYIAELEEYLSSGNLAEDFKWSVEERRGVYNVDIFKLFSSKTCACVATGKVAADVEVDNSIVSFESFLKKICIVCYVNSSSLTDACTAFNIVENILRDNLKSVTERFVAFVYIKGNDFDIIFFYKLF